MAELVDGVERATVTSTDALLRSTGCAQPPTVHILRTDDRVPYVGYLTVRPFTRGDDAASAIGLLGVLPSLLRASHLVVTWEYADLCRALELPGATFPNGLVVLEASMTGHTVRWHPFRIQLDVRDRVLLDWGPPARHPGGKLPGPVEGLVRCWQRRTWRDDPIESAVSTLQASGYAMHWAA